MQRITRTESGLVRGTAGADPRITAFLGVPYAASTAGENRWRVPQPRESWEGVRDCIYYGPAPMQRRPGVGASVNTAEWHVDPDIEMSEDCLSLNIWTPEGFEGKKLPVLVFIYGGAYLWGYTCQMELDGERLARRGIVVVTINYRLNAFGFLAHPELTAETGGHGAANFGLYDQRFALDWLRRNIAAFGGDPDCITLAGQSAGAGSVAAQLISPLTPKNTIRRAIIQSGGGLKGRTMPLAEAEENGERFFELLGVKSLAEARAIPAEKLRDVIFAHLEEYKWRPCLDGGFLVEDNAAAIAAGRVGAREVMLGHTTNDMPALHEGVAAMAEALTEQGIGCYLYRFDGYMPGDGQGAFHSSELWFMFESLEKCWRPLDGRHYDLARQMCNCWANFAKTGDPNGTDHGKPLPEWRPYDPKKPEGIVFNFATHMEDWDDFHSTKKPETKIDYDKLAERS